jgi:hypothetical protein
VLGVKGAGFEIQFERYGVRVPRLGSRVQNS